MPTHKVELHSQDEAGLFARADQFSGSEQECIDFVKNFRQLASNEVGMVIILIQE